MIYRLGSQFAEGPTPGGEAWVVFRYPGTPECEDIFGFVARWAGDVARGEEQPLNYSYTG